MLSLQNMNQPNIFERKKTSWKYIYTLLNMKAGNNSINPVLKDMLCHSVKNHITVNVN